MARNDFLELYNPDPLPVALGGLFLSDAAGAPTRHPIAPLSFIAGKGCAEFIADSDPEQGADHLSFKLSPDVGLILLSSPDLELIDAVNYGAQRTDVSEGRSPNGADTFTTFAQPTPGGGNPGTALGDCTLATTTVNLLSLGATWKYNQTANLDGTGWYLSDYNDSAWPSGPALLAVESSALPSPGKLTTLTLGRTTYYFRTRFVVDTNLDGFNLNLKLVVDDGALVYLNGTRLLTNGLNTGTPSYRRSPRAMSATPRPSSSPCRPARWSRERTSSRPRCIRSMPTAAISFGASRSTRRAPTPTARPAVSLNLAAERGPGRQSNARQLQRRHRRLHRTLQHRHQRGGPRGPQPHR